MLPGPVFNVELMTTARRARYYMVRVFYSAVLLMVVWGVYEQVLSVHLTGGGGLTGLEMAMFASQTVAQFVTIQDVAVLLLTPALVAGVIASERQRKTLHYLLASRLSSFEIVLGKIAARLLHIATLLAIGLPIMSLMSLFGGIDPVYIGLSFAGSLATSLFIASFSIWISTFARSAREAIFLAYLLELAWLGVPPVLMYSLRQYELSTLYNLAESVVKALLVTDPLAMRWGLDWSAPGDRSIFLHKIRWMCGLQILGAGSITAISTWRLRPNFKRQGGPGKLTVWTTPHNWRIFRRPACSGDGMLWKEYYASHGGKLARLFAVPIACVISILVCWFMVDYAAAAFGDPSYRARPSMAEFEPPSYSTYSTLNFPQSAFHEALSDATGIFSLLWLVGVGCAAAGGVSTEREEDTWISLTATDLSGREILNAKMRGAAWRCRWILFVILGLWLVGAASGAIHPLGFGLATLELAIFTWFFAALGIYWSTRSKTTTRALALTIAGLWIFNGGYLAKPIPLPIETPLASIGSSFSILRTSLLSYRDVEALTRPHPTWKGSNEGKGYTSIALPVSGVMSARQAPLRIGMTAAQPQRTVEMWEARIGKFYSPFASPDWRETLACCLVGSLGFAAGAILLTKMSYRSFERLVDRPRRGAAKSPPS